MFNLSREEKVTLDFLVKHRTEEFIIKNKDKNVLLLIMSYAWYFSQCFAHLSSSTSRKLSDIEVKINISNTIFTLRALGKKHASILDKDLQTYLLS